MDNRCPDCSGPLSPQGDRFGFNPLMKCPGCGAIWNQRALRLAQDERQSAEWAKQDPEARRLQADKDIEELF